MDVGTRYRETAEREAPSKQRADVLEETFSFKFVLTAALADPPSSNANPYSDSPTLVVSFRTARRSRTCL
jgi:hypothetical protein